MSEGKVSSRHDARPHFELNVSLPHDARFAETARELAAHAARHAGYGEDEARAFGSHVEGVVRGCFDTAPTGSPVPLIVRRAAGPLEVLVNGRTITPHP
jgi:hypothetical protein